MVTFDRDPQQAMATWADAASAQYKPRKWPKIPAGWVGWSWVDPFTVERYEDVVRRNAAAISRRLPGYGIDYIWVSCGNLKDIIPGNWLDWNTESFPTPPRAVGQRPAEPGLQARPVDCPVLDVYPCRSSASAGSEGRSAVARRQADRDPVSLVLRRLAPRCRRGSGRTCTSLDPTHPKTQAFLKKVFATYYGWGVRYYMIDFLESISGLNPGHYLYDACYQRDLIHGPEVYRAGLKLVREAAGPDTYLLGTNPSAAIQGVGMFDGCRVGTDYGEGRPLAPDAGFYPGTFVINRPSFWTSHRTGTDTLATAGFLHRKFFLADTGNVLTLDKPCPLGEAQIAATIFGINGGPMMLGDDVDRMADERLAMVKKCLPRLPEAARSLDLFECPEPDYPKLFHLPVQNPWDRWDLVALFNYDSEPAQVHAGLEAIGPRCRSRLRGVGFLERAVRRHLPGDAASDGCPADGEARASFAQAAASLADVHRHARPPGPGGDRGLPVGRRRDDAAVPGAAAGGRARQRLRARAAGLEVVDPRGLWLAKDGRSATGRSLSAAPWTSPAAPGRRRSASRRSPALDANRGTDTLRVSCLSASEPSLPSWCARR